MEIAIYITVQAYDRKVIFHSKGVLISQEIALT